MKFLRNLKKNSAGATAIEYGLIISLIVLVMITALQDVAEKNTTMWGYVQTEVTTP